MSNIPLNTYVKITPFVQKWAKCSEPVYYIPNPGNAGDAAIATATVQFFHRINVPLVHIRAENIPSGAVVVIAGGGNLVPYYTDIRKILLACLARNVKKCLLLPHTVRGHADVLARLDTRFTILCRDKPSYEYVKKHAPHVHTALARDMVFELDIEELKRSTKTWRHKLSLLRDSHWLKNLLRWRRATARIRPDSHGTLRIFQHDGESAHPDRAKRKFDLMRFNGIREYSPATDQITMDVIKCINRAERVITDRLHVSLVAAMLGKKVCLLENSYGKVSDVWELEMEIGLKLYPSEFSN